MSYSKVDPNAYNEEVKKANGESITFFYAVPEKGDNIFCCPPREGERVPHKEVLVHYNVREGRIWCLRNWGLDCPICKGNDELYAMKQNLAAQQLSKDIYAKKNYLYNIIPMLNVQVTGQTGVLYYNGLALGSKEPAKVRPWCMGQKLHKMISNFYSIYGDIFDPTSGNMIILTKMNNSTDPKFASVFASPHPIKSRLADDLMKLLDNMPDLNKVFTPEDAGILQGIIDVKLAAFRTGAVSVPSAPTQTVQQPQVQAQVQVQPQVQVQNTPAPVPQQTMLPPTPPAAVNISAPTAPATMPTAPVVSAVQTPPQAVPGTQNLAELEAFIRANKK